MEAHQLVALAVGATACVTDVRSRRIPNVLTFGAAAAGVLFHALAPTGSGGLTAVEGWLVGAAMFVVPFALGGLGGGDLKLLAAIGAWLGPAGAMWTGLYTGIAGGVMALVVSAYHGYLRQALSNVWFILQHWRVMGVQPLSGFTLDTARGPRLAYALPIFAGLVAATWLA